MKKLDLRKLIREVIREQSYNFANKLITPQGVVGAKGCCKDLHLIQNFIAGHQQNITNTQEMIYWLQTGIGVGSGGLTGGDESIWDIVPVVGDILQGMNTNQQLQILNDYIEQAEAAIANAEDIFNEIQATGCCKGDRY